MNNFFIFLIILFFGLSFDRLNVFKYCIISSILHELGHIVSYRFFIKRWPEIKISIFGFKMINDIQNSNFNIVILLFGPLVNFLIVIISSFVLYFKFKLDIYVLLCVNIIIFVLNVMPIYYLDGGQILYNISNFYQRKYRMISIISLSFLLVIYLIYAGNILPILVFLMYFIINIVNDI